MTPKEPRYTTPFLTLLTPEQHAALKAAAEAEGASMGDVMREALDAWLRKIGPITPPTPQED